VNLTEGARRYLKVLKTHKQKQAKEIKRSEKGRPLRERQRTTLSLSLFLNGHKQIDSVD